MGRSQEVSMKATALIIMGLDQVEAWMSEKWVDPG